MSTQNPEYTQREMEHLSMLAEDFVYFVQQFDWLDVENRAIHRLIDEDNRDPVFYPDEISYVAAWVAWKTVFNPDHAVMWLSKPLQGARFARKRIREYLQLPEKFTSKPIHDNQNEIQLACGSTVLFRSANIQSLRGYSIHDFVFHGVDAGKLYEDLVNHTLPTRCVRNSRILTLPSY